MAQRNEFEVLIDPKDLPILKLITKAAKPYSQRAQALIELNKGRSQEDAAEISGLRLTQVRYWLRVYRSSGLDVFPEDLLQDEAELTDISEALKAEDKKESVSRPPSAKSVAKKAKKGKKNKKSDKKKKETGKKKKKDKPGKKPVKKSGKKEKKNKKKGKKKK